MKVLPPRGRFDGVWNILRFNWPFYIAALAAGAAGIIFLSRMQWPLWLAFLGWSSIGLAFFWLLVSLLVSFYVYDVSPLYKFTWLKSLFAQTPRTWVNIHSGLDESSLLLQAIFPTDNHFVLDIYNPKTMTEPAIKRARAAIAPPVPAIAADCQSLPLADNSIDAVFLLFAAHEIRKPSERLKFFQELQRITTPGAKVILVEHLRDAANFIAFGPGFLHFLPRREWRRLSCASGFVIHDTFRITPFVRVFVLQNSHTGTKY